MDNKEIVKQYFRKYFKYHNFKESDYEFISLLKILRIKDNQIKEVDTNANHDECDATESDIY